jgi:uncharacterized protein (TIGR04255 family)
MDVVDMFLEDPKRVIYQKNPLIEVISQIRFNTILKITESPSLFQEDVRHDYPLLKRRLHVQLQNPPSVIINEEFIQKMQKSEQSSQFVYDFSSTDENWIITLSADFIALTCKNYMRWEEFSTRLERIIHSLTKIYAPPFYERIGLRYQNVIHRSELGLDVSWADLLNPTIAGELVDRDISTSVENFQAISLLTLQKYNAKVRIHRELVKTNDDKQEICFLIDNDFFVSEEIELGASNEILTYLNGQSRRLFRWCITDKLHNAMEPEPIT